MSNSKKERFDRDDDCDSFGDLLQQAIDGDSSAITQIVESFRPYLLLIANQDFDRNLQAKLAPSDLVQSALLAAQQNFKSFQGGSIEGLRVWVKKILQNGMIDATRKFKQTAKRQSGREVPIVGAQHAGACDSQVNPLRQSILHEQAEMLEQAMTELPENYRQAIRWRNWEQLSFPEMGKRFGTGEDAARKLWARAMVQLQEIVKSRYSSLDSQKPDFPPHS